MKSYTKHSLLALAALSMLSITGCKDDEVYDTQVTREYNLYLDGEAWFNKTEDSHTYGDWNVYIYKSDNSLKGNFKTQYRFALESGNYKVFSIYCTTVSDFFEPSLPLNEVEVKQDEAMATSFAVSDIVNYKAGDPLNVYMTTRTGLLRLRANDEKADKSYTQLKATITTPVHAYRPIDSSVDVEGEPLVMTRLKETTGGGIGYAEDMLLIGSDYPVNISIDYLDKDGNVVRSKSFAEGIVVAPNDTTTVSFALNDPTEQVIVNYTVEVGSTSWNNETQYPSVPVVVPDGYIYVKPEDDINAIFKEQANDASVDEIRLFLKANTAYSLSEANVTNIGKSVSILGQTPGYGQSKAQLTLGASATIAGTVNNIRFENLALKGNTRFFNIRNQAFNVGEIAFVDCLMDSWTGILWYQVTNANDQQTVGTMRLEGCSFVNYTAQAQPLYYLPTNYQAPISNFVIKNNVFHEKAFTTRTVILSRLTKMTNPINVNVEGNTFIATRATDFTYFDLDNANLNLTVKNNMVTGASTGYGTWFKLGKTATLDVQGNERSAGYSMKNWGVEAPAESATTYNDILKKLNL